MKTSESKTLPPKNLIFMNRGERTEYQPTLSHNLDPTRSLGRSKLTNYEFLIDQNRDKQTECPPDRNPRIANKETNKRVSHSVELFSQETSKQQKRPSTDMPSNGTMQNRFLNLDNFFICLAYDDLMVGISDSTNCF